MNLVEKLRARNPQGGVFQLENRLAPSVLHRQASAQGLCCFHIRGKGIQAKSTFLEAISQAMDFPKCFGGNWDAMEDCITDLSWKPARGYYLLYDHAGEFAQAAPGDFATALEIFLAATDFWASQTKPMWILLRDRRPIPKLAVFR